MTDILSKYNHPKHGDSVRTQEDELRSYIRTAQENSTRQRRTKITLPTFKFKAEE